MEEESSLGKSRAKRQKIDKSGKSAAFERLKSLKGKKNKYNVGEIENVYDEVDEKEYSRRVLERQDDDWLERPGDGYVEDGREIFDDGDGDEEAIFDSKKSKSSKRKNISEKSHKSSKSILQMVANMPVKKKKVEDDSVLDDLMGELCSSSKPKPSEDESLSSKQYLMSIAKVQKETWKPESKSFIINHPNNTSLNEVKNKTLTEENFLIKGNDIECIENELERSDVNISIANDTVCTDNETFEEIDVTAPSHSANVNYLNKINLENKECFTDLKIDAFADDFDEMISEQKNATNSAKGKVKEELPSNTWEENISNVNIPVENISIDKSDLPLVKNEQGENILRFFWWDAYEDPFKQPGVIYLFGKVFHENKKSFVSCCVCIENVERRIFLLPREKRFDFNTNTTTDNLVTLLDVYQEFNDKVATSNKIMNFKSRKVVRKYAFELQDVPEESEYLEVKYSSTYPKLPQDLTGETFSRVFGTNSGNLELFLLEQKIKGPCWLEVKNPQISKVQYSWCKIETRCSKPEDVVASKNITPPPPLLVMAVNIRSVVNTKNMENEIVMISCLIHNEYRVEKPAPNPPFKYHFCALTRPACLTWPHDFENFLPNYKKTETIIHQAERSLLNYFLTRLYTIDPDVLIGHDLYGFTMETLLHRIQYFKVANWSRIGRLKRTVLPQLKGKQAEKNLTCGRLVCDLNISARELIKARSYDMDSLCKQILNLKENDRRDYSSEEIIEKYEKTSSILNLISNTVKDTSYILRLFYELNVLPLALQITNIAGNVLSRTLLGGRSERNEFLLLHAFSEKDYLVPDKKYSQKGVVIDEETEMMPKNSKKKPQYMGGLVLEPKKGFYDKFVLLMDFNSLYPSIIQEYNICFTTVQRVGDEDTELEAPDTNLPLGVLPAEIQKLVESRRQVKALMKAQDLSSEQHMQYNIRQMALKLTANSMYGCLGFPHSRFYAKPLAALITSKGREILMNTKDVVQRMNYEVIYGDTDSIMINTNCTDYDEVFKIGHGIKQEINKVYKYVELEVDGVFKYMLLLKKKKYAAVVLSKKPDGEITAAQEYKGLDIVRRDWCQLSAEVGRHVLNQILSDLNPDERIFNIKEHLERIAQDLRNKVVPIPLLAITKQLNKNPEDYPDKKSLPHLQVALRINSRGGKKLKAGDAVPYVICDDGSNLPAVQRAYHLDELKMNGNLLVDVNYYLSQQIHPVVSRLCEPIHGADPAFVAECLGLDLKSYRKVAQKIEDEELDPEDYTLINDIKSFKNCEKFTFQCINERCKTKIFMDGPMRDNRPALSKCRNPSCNTSPIEYLPSILNALNLSIRHYVGKFYQNWMICEDPSCPNRTQRVPLAFRDSFPVCTLCKKGLMYREFRNADLYYQLKYFEFIFNIKRLKIPMDPELENGYKVLQERAVQALNQSAYRILDLGKIFKFTSNINKQGEKFVKTNKFSNL